jgi:hypothetical protein
VGNAATQFALDLLWKRSKQHELANMALMASLSNFCIFETGRKILNDPAPTGQLRFGGLIFLAKKQYRGNGDVMCRPFAGHTPEPFSEEDVLDIVAAFVANDAKNHPELKKRFPINKFLRKHL